MRPAVSIPALAACCVLAACGSGPSGGPLVFDVPVGTVLTYRHEGTAVFSPGTPRVSVDRGLEPDPAEVDALVGALDRRVATTARISMRVFNREPDDTVQVSVRGDGTARTLTRFADLAFRAEVRYRPDGSVQLTDRTARAGAADRETARMLEQVVAGQAVGVYGREPVTGQAVEHTQRISLPSPAAETDTHGAEVALTTRTTYRGRGDGHHVFTQKLRIAPAVIDLTDTRAEGYTLRMVLRAGGGTGETRVADDGAVVRQTGTLRFAYDLVITRTRPGQVLRIRVPLTVTRTFSLEAVKA